MTEHEARKAVGQLVMSTDPKGKMVTSLPEHGPYRISLVKADGRVELDRPIAGNGVNVVSREFLTFVRRTK